MQLVVRPKYIMIMGGVKFKFVKNPSLKRGPEFYRYATELFD